MPGRFFLTSDLADIAAFVGLPIQNNELQPPRRNISPGQEIVTGTCDGLQLMRWGIIPVGRKNARGRPVMETLINARSETVFDKSAYADVGRAIVPADGWYEWTGETRKKTAWRIRRNDGVPLIFAAIYDVWTAPGGLRVPQVATVTCPPNADVKEIHHRMGVVLDPRDVPTWLNADENTAKSLMVPLSPGQLTVEPANDIDWSAP